MGLYDTHVGLSLVYVAFGLPLSILVLRSFFAGIPRELLEAARIDGGSERCDPTGAWWCLWPRRPSPRWRS